MTNDELAEALEKLASFMVGGPAAGTLHQAARRLRETEQIAMTMLHDARCDFDVAECTCGLDSLRRVTGGRS